MNETNIKPFEKKKTGDKFIISGSTNITERYILSLVGCKRNYKDRTKDKFLMCLIGLDGGNRWENPIPVKDSRNVTEKEWLKITGGGDEYVFSKI